MNSPRCALPCALVLAALGLCCGGCPAPKPSATQLSISNDSGVAAEIAVEVDGVLERYSLAPGEARSVEVAACPNSVRLVDLLLREGELTSTSTLADAQDGRLAVGTNYDCGDEIQIEIGREQTTWQTLAP